MRILFLGDIVGKPGRTCVQQLLPKLRQELQVDAVVANAENAAAGAGLTAAIAHELASYGIDAITLGDHVWDQRGFTSEIVNLTHVCRPANLPHENPGRTHLIIEVNGHRLGIATLLGRSYMRTLADCPFRTADTLTRQLSGQCDALLLEIHAETTSEKIAFGWYLDGRAALIIGTHTHIPTADTRILPRGSAYQTDAGMTGPYDSVLGRETQPIIAKFLDGLPRKWPVAQGDIRLSGILVEINPATGLATHCERIDRPYLPESTSQPEPSDS